MKASQNILNSLIKQKIFHLVVRLGEMSGLGIHKKNEHGPDFTRAVWSILDGRIP